MKRFIAIFLIVAGIAVVAYPSVTEWLEVREQERLMAEWEASLFDETANEAVQEQFQDLTDLFSDGLEEASEQTAEPSAEPEQEAEPAKPEAIATLIIDSIDLKIPVLEGATQANLKYAGGHMTETAGIGEVGNAAIAAHRMRTKGRLFNRLPDVKVGDKIVVDTKEESFTYTVYKISRVLPTDVSVLNYNKTDRLLTLITCDPIVNPTHRWIVHAKI